MKEEQRASGLPLAGTRILFVTPQPFYEHRGSPIAVLQVLRAISELGIHVDLLAFPSGQSVEIENLRIFRYGKALPIHRVPIGFSWRKVLLDFALMRGVRSRLKAERYACIHALEDGIFVSLALPSASRIPIIYDMHSCYSRATINASAISQLSRSVDIEKNGTLCHPEIDGCQLQWRIEGVHTVHCPGHPGDGMVVH